MATLYLILGAAGSTILILQFAMTLLGFGHHDFDTGHFDAAADGAAHVGGGDVHDHVVDHNESSIFFKMLSFRAMTAAATFFGWSGLAALQGGLSTIRSFSVAFGAGLLSMYLVAWLLRALSSLHAEGNVQISRTIGALGTVYLTIPGSRQGVGKVHVNVQERTMEYSAITQDEKLATGMPVVVVGIVDNDTLEVRPAPRMEVID